MENREIKVLSYLHNPLILNIVYAKNFHACVTQTFCKFYFFHYVYVYVGIPA